LFILVKAINCVNLYIDVSATVSNASLLLHLFGLQYLWQNEKHKKPHCRNMSKILQKFRRNRRNIDSPNRHIHNCLHLWLCKGTSIETWRG